MMATVPMPLANVPPVGLANGEPMTTLAAPVNAFAPVKVNTVAAALLAPSR